MASVTLRDLAVRYPDGSLGLEGIDLDVADGEFVALVGPSGSGKTTLLRTIAGFLAPASGTVTIGDRVVAGDGRPVPPERRGLGMVFQQHAVWPHWNVARNVEYPLRRAGMPRAERAAAVGRALDLVGLAGFDRRDPASLSGGQRQRVALARAIVAQPRVLLLDEALSALDEPLRNELRLELRELTRSIGLTVVHVTHDRGEALALADRVAVLDRGRLQQFAPPAELLQAPASPVVARFIDDATTFEGERSASGFAATAHPVRVADGLVSTHGAGLGSGCLTVAPDDVALTAPDADAAVVVSSLYGRDAHDVVVDWAGVRVRVRHRGERPDVGDRVGVRVERGTWFAN